jgi:hypothetical protein
LGLILTFLGFSALRCAMVRYLQIFFGLNLITVKQYSKERGQVDPVTNIREISEKYGIPAQKIRELPNSLERMIVRE